jgi:hypothetical protein
MGKFGALLIDGNRRDLAVENPRRVGIEKLWISLPIGINGIEVSKIERSGPRRYRVFEGNRE